MDISSTNSVNACNTGMSRNSVGSEVSRLEKEIGKLQEELEELKSGESGQETKQRQIQLIEQQISQLKMQLQIEKARREKNGSTNKGLKPEKDGEGAAQNRIDIKI